MPEQAIDMAKAAIASAHDANVEKYAPQGLYIAETLVLNAIALWHEGNIIQAKLCAEEARKQAENTLEITKRTQKAIASTPSDNPAGGHTLNKEEGSTESNRRIQA